MPGWRGCRSSTSRSARAWTIPEQPLDPKIIEAAFKLWDWSPGKKHNNNEEELNAPFGMVRILTELLAMAGRLDRTLVSCP